MFKKIITSIVLACFLMVNVGAQVIYADEIESTWYYQDYFEWYDRVYDDDNPDEIFGERYTAAQVEWVIYGVGAFVINHVVGNTGIISCVIEGVISETETITTACVQNIIDNLKSILNIDTSAYIQDQESNIYAQSGNPINDILSGNRSISGIGYIKGAVSGFSPVTEVKAQGFGFEAAGSIREIWVVIRNITYFFLILLIISMAFMVMFRFKINPQTVITVQSALPKVIGALILITFSYAIAGFVIDLMYVVIGLVAAILSQSGLFDLDWSEMYENLTGSAFGTGLFGVMSFYLLSFFVTCIYALGSNILGAAVFPITSIIGFLITIIVAIALLIIMIKILWMLIKAFVGSLLLIAAGPIFIITGGIGGWLKNLASNLAVFVAIGPMFAFSFLFLASALPSWPLDFEQVVADAMPFNPEANVLGTSPWSPPFLGFKDMDIVWLFASFVIITMIPNVANIIKSAIQRRPFGYGTAVGAALGAAAGAAWSPFGDAFGVAKEQYYKERFAKVGTSMASSKWGQALRQFIGR